jgi:hypothetical protein
MKFKHQKSKKRIKLMIEKNNKSNKQKIFCLVTTLINMVLSNSSTHKRPFRLVSIYVSAFIKKDKTQKRK